MSDKIKTEIIPALLPENFEQLEKEIHHVRNSAEYVQIDVVDGKFAPTKTWPYNQKDSDIWEELKKQDKGLPYWEKINFEIDLMVMDQISAAKDWISVGVSRIIGHIEAFNKNFGQENQPFEIDEEKISEFLNFKDEYFVEIVLSLNPSTDNSVIEPFLSRIDGVQFMGNDKIGYHGVELDEKVLEKIKSLRQSNPDLPIGIDIGVAFETLEKLAIAGVNRFSSGSLVLNSSEPKKTIKDMLEVIESVK